MSPLVTVILDVSIKTGFHYAIENVTSFTYLGSVIAVDERTEQDVMQKRTK